MNTMTKAILSLTIAFSAICAQAQDASKLKEARVAQIQKQIDTLSTEVKALQTTLLSGTRVFEDKGNQMVIASAVTYNMARAAIAGLKANHDPTVISLEMIAAGAKTIVVAGGSVYLLDVGLTNLVIYQKNREISRLTADLAELNR